MHRFIQTPERLVSSPRSYLDRTCCGILLECKVLNDPIVPSKLANVVGKLGTKDDELFHAKLRKKVTWARTLRLCPANHLVGALLVDRGAYSGRGAEHLAMDYDDLKEWLAESTSILHGASTKRTDHAERSR